MMITYHLLGSKLSSLECAQILVLGKRVVLLVPRDAPVLRPGVPISIQPNLLLLPLAGVETKSLVRAPGAHVPRRGVPRAPAPGGGRGVFITRPTGGGVPPDVGHADACVAPDRAGGGVPAAASVLRGPLLFVGAPPGPAPIPIAI